MGLGEYKSLCGDEWKMAFKMIFILHKWLVFPFGLTNVPSIFMWLMNHVSHAVLRKFVVVYFDDMLVYSRSIKEYAMHLRCVF